ncbi:MAG TPA: FkbM family methyltransferase [Vicinamibacterales bacterium]|nr:FkbM family methyltransferase [Vicinamibacterales bacterium]
MAELIRAPLRAARAAIAGAIASAVDRVPSLEPWFVRAGRSVARRSRLGGGAYWFAQESLIAKLQARNDCYRGVEVRNIPLIVDVTDATGRFPYFYAQPYEKGVTDAIITALRAGDVFLDVGANIGYFSTLAARLVGPSGRVIAFEPHAGARAALLANTERNGVAGLVEIVPIALAEREGEMTAEIQATTLDRWLEGRPELSARVRCIKIDVEGAEARVIAGMQRSLRSTGLTVICDTTIGSDADAALEAARFVRHRIERGGQTHGHFLYVRPGALIL